MRAYKHLGTVTAAVCVALVLSNILAAKLVSLFGVFVVNGATLIYPLTFLLSDIATEVYGYAAARRIIWTAFSLQVAALVGILITLHTPGVIPPQAEAFNRTLDLSFWIVFGSLVAFWCGDFLNSFVISRLKVRTSGRHLFLRTWLSTIVGQAADTLLFVSIAFGLGNYATGHPLPLRTFWSLLWGVYVLKVLVEVVLTPLVYVVVNAVKRSEHLDTFDRQIRYSPFLVPAKTDEVEGSAAGAY